MIPLTNDHNFPISYSSHNSRPPNEDRTHTLDLLMPLQPRRNWSPEDERRRRLEEDPDAYDVTPHSVTCAGCHRPIRLNATGRYYAANWNKHKMGCKNTTAVNGGNVTSMVSTAIVISITNAVTRASVGHLHAEWLVLGRSLNSMVE